MKMRSLIFSATLACGLLSASKTYAVDAAYIHILKNELTETRFHLSEVEAFSEETVPDGLGGATFGGLATSTNDIGNGTLVAFGVGNLYPALGTTDSIQHGAANQNPDNLLQNAGNVWSTNTGQATESQYTLDLGGTHDVTTVRLWPRADTCCADRWRSIEVQLLDAAGNPIADTLRLATAPGGMGRIFMQICFAPTVSAEAPAP